MVCFSIAEREPNHHSISEVGFHGVRDLRALQQGRRSGALRAHGLNPDFYTVRERDKDEIFPWEITDHGVSRETLRKVYVEALAAGRAAP